MLLPLQNFSFLIKDLNHHYSGFKNAVVKVRGLEKLFVSKTNIEIFDFLGLLSSRIKGGKSSSESAGMELADSVEDDRRDVEESLSDLE